MFRFEIRAEFPATHRIRIDSRGTLEPLHAHNWRITVRLATSRSPAPVVRRAQAALQTWVERHRGRCFNDLPPFHRINPTAEEVARSLAEELAGAVPEARVGQVEVGEAAGFAARYWPGSDAGS